MLGSGSRGSSRSAGDGELLLPEVVISKEGVYLRLRPTGMRA